MSVGIVCLGWQWVPYRYSRTRPDGGPVAPFPGWLGEWSRQAVADAAALDPALPATVEPDVALVNWYEETARMGLHADREERSEAPVVSFSLGDRAVFRFGNVDGKVRPWADVPLESGDVFVFGGPARRAYHGVTKVLPGSAPPDSPVRSGRLNVTVRQSGLTDGDNGPSARAEGLG